MGITSCLGNTLDDVRRSLFDCEPGIEFDQEWADLGIRSNVRGRPKFTQAEFKEQIPKAALRFMGTNAKYAYIAMRDAVEDSGMAPGDYQENPRVCAILGQGGTSIPDIVETVDAVKGGGRWKNKVGPFRVTRSMGSTVSAVLATAFKIQGMSFSISSACSTGAHCIGTGYEQILLNKSDMAFCGAGENVDWDFTSMFDCMGALSTSYNDNPKKASRAFDKNRDGFCIAAAGGSSSSRSSSTPRRGGPRSTRSSRGTGPTRTGTTWSRPPAWAGSGAWRSPWPTPTPTTARSRSITSTRTEPPRRWEISQNSEPSKGCSRIRDTNPMSDRRRVSRGMRLEPPACMKLFTPSS